MGMSERTFTRRIVTEYRVPEEALRMNEDIRAFEQAIKLLRTVDSFTSFGMHSPNENELWLIIQKIGMLRRDVQDKLRHEYLAPKEKIERRTRTTV
jgi:hypothetical protein